MLDKVDPSRLTNSISFDGIGLEIITSIYAENVQSTTGFYRA